MSICPHCAQDLPPSSFFKHSGRKTGHSILCKPCFSAYEASPERRAKRTWNTINARAGSQQGYSHVKVKMTRDDFLSWAIPAYKSWSVDNPDLVPSLDRIDPLGHYELTNLRLLERGENSRLASNHPNVHAPDGLAWCHACCAMLPKDLFWRSATNYNGLQGRCKPCQTQAIMRSRESLSS